MRRPSPIWETRRVDVLFTSKAGITRISTDGLMQSSTTRFKARFKVSRKVCKLLNRFYFHLRLYSRSCVSFHRGWVAVVSERIGQIYAPPCIHTCSDFQLVFTREHARIHARDIT